MESDDDDNVCGLAFMFDAQHHKALQTYELENNIKVSIKMISDTPGHVQSGQYLWPAAISASNYLIENWQNLRSVNVLELGAGCGFTGIVARKLQQKDDISGSSRVIFTDYDPGALTLINENIELNGLSSTETNYMRWGEAVPDEIRAMHRYPMEGFNLIVGADLLYCLGVVQPLFTTVAAILAQDGKFLLVTSFGLDNSIESEINDACRSRCLVREEKIALDENNGICRVELYFRTE